MRLCSLGGFATVSDCAGDSATSKIVCGPARCCHCACKDVVPGD